MLERRINIGPGCRVYFGRDGDTVVVLLGGGTKLVSSETSNTLVSCGRSTGVASAGRCDMPLTRDFKETVQARAERDPAFREGLLKEGVECLLAGDVDTGKIVLRDYINATIGFEELGSLTNKQPISRIQQHEGVQLEVTAVR